MEAQMGDHSAANVEMVDATDMGIKGEECFGKEISQSAHDIGQDPWLQVALILITSLNSAFVLGYPKLIMANLGWFAGASLFLLGGLLSLYASTLIASLHFVGGIRHIRYRDLAGHVYGPNMYLTTWILQYSNLFTINTGFIILAGQAAKGAYSLYNYSGDVKLAHWIIIIGGLCFLFAFFIPTLSAMRIWLGVSTLLTVIYIGIVFVLSLKDGIRRPSRNYSIHGTTATEVFNIIGAIANIAFSYNTGILPEIQATIKDPVIKNIKKALYLQFSFGSTILYIVTFAGYWAYGSRVSAYLPNDTTGPKVVILIANVAVLLQTVISLHVFASPMYEFWDTKFAKRNEGPWSTYNMAIRFAARGSYLAFNTFVAALLPFLGDFTNLTGAISTFPLTFVLANHMYLTVRKKELGNFRRGWHWFNIIFFSILSINSLISAIRLIVVDWTNYNVFANV